MRSFRSPIGALLFAAAVATTLTSRPALAQSSVKLTGVVDTFVGSMRNSGDPTSTLMMGSSGMTTSWWGIQGTEDMGGGMKVNFNLGAFYRPANGAGGRFAGNETFFSRDANVGLSGGYGTLTMGRALAPNFLPMILFNPFGDSFTFAPLVLHMHVPLFNGTSWSNSVGGDTGWSNEVIYTTPTFGGATVNLHYQFGNTAGNTGKNNMGGNVLYFNGPLSLSAFYHRLKVNNPIDTPVGVVQSYGGLSASEQTAWLVAGGYDFKVVKLFGSFGQTSHNVNLNDKTYSLGASIPAGPGKFMAAWAETKRSGTGFADVKRDTISFGYDYDFSKRTDLYAVLMNDKVSGFSSGNSLGVGIRHRF
jgi:predicted porin